MVSMPRGPSVLGGRVASVGGAAGSGRVVPPAADASGCRPPVAASAGRMAVSDVDAGGACCVPAGVPASVLSFMAVLNPGGGGPACLKSGYLHGGDSQGRCVDGDRPGAYSRRGW